MHYPSPSPSYPFNPGLILQQAQRLRDDASAASGVEVMLQNQELLGVRAGGSAAVDISEPPASPGYSFFGRNTPSPGPNGRARARGGVQSLAQGLFERAQKAGLDKAILSTVTDLRVSVRTRNDADQSRTVFPILRRIRSSHRPTPTAGRRPRTRRYPPRLLPYLHVRRSLRRRPPTPSLSARY